MSATSLAMPYERFSGETRYDELMFRHTVWGIGGRADRFFVPNDEADLVAFLADMSPDEPIFWLGLGSNVLVRDGGLRGTVIDTAKLSNIELAPASIGDATRVR